MLLVYYSFHLTLSKPVLSEVEGGEGRGEALNLWISLFAQFSTPLYLCARFY